MTERRSRPRKRAVPAPGVRGVLSEGLVQDILRDGSASHPLTGQVLTTADLPDALRGGTANGCT